MATTVRRVSTSLGSLLLVATAISRTVLPAGMRLLAKSASSELFQLIIIAFCLVLSWITGYLVSLCAQIGRLVGSAGLCAC